MVFVGAGSHSGACLPGDYMVTVEPAVFRRLLAAWRRLTRLLLPWTRDREGTAFGIPFIDYRRGDGLSVGPGEERGWSPVLIDDTTPWLRDYRGLWGLETGDPFGGERAPAGPRYERTGSVRRCWSDPVGWAGLDKVSPTPGQSCRPSRTGWRSWTVSSPPPGRSWTPGRTSCETPRSGSGRYATSGCQPTGPGSPDWRPPSNRSGGAIVRSPMSTRRWPARPCSA